MSKFEYGKYFAPIRPLAEALRQREERFWHPGGEAAGSTPDYVLYLGCNVLRTVNLAENMVAVLERMGVSFVAAGGTVYCCGIVHHRNGDDDISAKMTSSTLGKFNRMAPKAVLVYCPSCHFHMDGLPPERQELEMPYLNVTAFLAARIPEMSLTTPVKRRVGLHFHPFNAQQETDAACTLQILQAIPGLEVVNLPAEEGWGRHCVGQLLNSGDGAGHEKRVTAMFDAARAAGCDAIATVYHSCYRELCGYEARQGLEFLNYIELVVEAMGMQPVPPQFKQMKLEGDPAAALARLTPAAAARGVSPTLLEEALNFHFAPGEPPA